MAKVTQKTEINTIDGTPEKRLFWSIISDYGLKTGVCELIDNALDFWLSRGQKENLTIEVSLDVERQLISVIDNAGGVKADDLRLLIVPGGSRNDLESEVIGIFGVGSKRAGVALGEQVHIRTRFRKEKSFELNVTQDWLESPDWHLPVYEIPDIRTDTTGVHISHLRDPLTKGDVSEMELHLAETYSWFINQGCILTLNGIPIVPISFDNWSYPPNHPPHTANFEYKAQNFKPLNISITAGLINDRDPERENYGVYFYCNHRLIVKELRVREVGYFVSSEAGVPHPDASLCRVIVHIQGPARIMPWNSSKSGINYSHPAFHALRPTLVPLTAHFSSLSRRLKSNWEREVFAHNVGVPKEIAPVDANAKTRLILPPLPRVNFHTIDKLRAANKKLLNDQPWLVGLVEAIGILDVVFKQKIDTKNRIALILLDSNFEISLKEFIVHEKALFPPKVFNDAYIANLFQNRRNVISEVLKKVSIPATLISKADHYYLLRNKLIHERATVGITDADINNYRKTIEAILKQLFKLKFPS